MESKPGNHGGRGAGRPDPFFRAPVTWGIVAAVALATALPWISPRTANPAETGNSHREGSSTPPSTSGRFGRPGQPELPHSGADAASLDPLDDYAAGIQDIEDLPREAEPPAGQLAPDQARVLVDSLATFNFEPGLSPSDTIHRWKETLGQLVDGKTSSIPAISEFLSRMQDLNLAEFPETSGLSHATLRLALIDALGQIGGPEAESALCAALRDTADPKEIATMARTLNELSPGTHGPETIAASREALELVRAGQFGTRDVGPLFEVFRAFGDGQTAEELLETAGDWTYYAMLAVAGMPSGTGLPALIESLRNTSAAPGESPDFAYRLLAQAALESGEASRALIEQAQAGRIPASAWVGIAEAVAGHEARIQSALLSQGLAALQQGSEVRAYQITLGNQSYLTAPLSSMSPAELDDRLELFDQLLAIAVDPAQLAALQSQRDQLAALSSRR